MDKERVYLIIVTIGAVFNVVSNLIFIPLWGHVGASITTVLSEGLIFLFTLYALRRVFGQLPSGLGLVRPMLSGLAMALFLWFFRDLHVLILILPAAAIYLGGLVILRAYNADELKIIQALLPTRLQQVFIIRSLIGESSSSR
jgi:O-antigen/teichoic acid export membrane protein